jgi:hypothetical protein
MSIQTIKPFYPIVLARRSAQSANFTGAAWNNVVWDTEDLDIFNTWDGTSFIAPRAGSYQIAVGLRSQPIGTQTGTTDVAIALDIGGAIWGIQRFYHALPVGIVYVSAIVPNLVLNANDNIKIKIYALFTGTSSFILSPGSLGNSLSISIN